MKNLTKRSNTSSRILLYMCTLFLIVTIFWAFNAWAKYGAIAVAIPALVGIVMYFNIRTARQTLGLRQPRN